MWKFLSVVTIWLEICFDLKDPSARLYKEHEGRLGQGMTALLTDADIWRDGLTERGRRLPSPAARVQCCCYCGSLVRAHPVKTYVLILYVNKHNLTLAIVLKNVTVRMNILHLQPYHYVVIWDQIKHRTLRMKVM